MVISWGESGFILSCITTTELWAATFSAISWYALLGPESSDFLIRGTPSSIEFTISELNGINQVKLDTNLDLFYKYEWPGNVRELRNLVERISILAVNEKRLNVNNLVQDALSQKNTKNQNEITENVFSYPLKEAREKFEKDYLTSQLKKHKGNISKTAEFIGMERSALHRKLKTLGVKGVN